jgi:hypothetical protein
MNAATSAFRILIRIAFAIQLALGLLFWSGNLRFLVNVHRLLGLLLVLGLWGLAVMAARARISPAVVAFVVVYGLVVPVLGELQIKLIPGSAHWIVQAVHLLIGLGFIALAELLGSLIGRSQATRLDSRGAAR